MKQVLSLKLLALLLMLGVNVNAQQLDPFGAGGFESGTTFPANGWTVVNAPTNAWYIGTLGASAGTNGAYISNNSGTSAAYTMTLTQVSHFYRDVTFPAGVTNIVLSFKWRAGGETGWDYMRVHVVPTTTAVTANVQLTAGQLSQFQLQSTFQTQTHNLPVGYAGTTQRVVFSWRNDGSLGTNPGGIIDEVSITYVSPTCTALPNNGVATTTTPTFNCSGAPLLNATGVSSATNITYQWETSLAGQNTWSDVGPALSSLPAYTAPVTNVSRDYRVKTTCPTFGTSTSAIVTVTVVSAVTGGTATAATQNIACNGDPSLNATGVSLGAGMTYQWQSSPAGQSTWSNVGAPLTTPNYIAPTIATSTDYQLITTCGPSSTTGTSSVVPITVQSITVTPATSSICETNSQVLAAVSPAPSNPTLYSENFNNGLPANMTFVNTSTGTNVAAGAWLIRADGYTDAFETLHSPTNTSFILTNSDDVGSGASVHTEMLTPVLNTSGYNSLSLNFSHYYYHLGSSYGRVEVFNGTSWVQVANYTGANVGSAASFASANISLNAYVNIPNFQVRFVYNAGWDYWWAIDDIVISGTAVASTYTWSSLDPGAGLPGTVNTQSISVTPTNGPGTYTYTVTSNNCGTATATVDVVPGPTATMTAADVCDGEPATLNFTGNPGDIVTFNTTESVTMDGAGEATYVTPPLSTGSYTYTINTIANAGCTVTSTLSETVVVNPRPSGQLFSNTLTVCKDQPASIAFSSSATDFPIDVTYSDGTNTYIHTVSSGSEYINVPSNVPGSFTYTITDITNQYGCDGAAGVGQGLVTVNDRPTATFSSSAAGVCPGGSADVTLTFTGTGPFIYEYTDGTTPVSGVELTNSLMFTVSPTADVTYSTVTLLDQTACAVTPADISSTVTIQAYDTSRIDVEPLSVSACTENSATITMTAVGDVLTYTWYEDGVQMTAGPNYAINDNTLTINDVSGLGGREYHVVVSGACGVDKISDTVTLTEDFDNSWSGTTSTAWSDATNWSCGNVPIITTNVIIPTSAPFMPLVDITTAICNDVTLDGTGATLGFDGTANVLSIHGDIMNNGGDFDGTDGIVVLAGTDQSITGATAYEDLEVAGGGTKVLGGAATVTGQLTLTDGFLAIGSNNLTIANMPAQTTGSATSYIVTDGTGEVVGQNMDADSVIFHVGLATSYNPVGIKNTGTPDTFMVRVMEHVYIDGYGTDPAQVDNPVVDRTWMISEQTPGGSFASVTPQWSTGEETNGFDQSHVYVAHYMGGNWTSPVDSTLFTPPAVAVGTMWSAMEDSIESFSPFAVASHGSFPLAIRLTTISAANAGPRNKVEWKSEKEAAGDMFELERSADAKSFTKIATIAANGKPSTYLHWDESPLQGVNYYRVKLVDANGNYSYSKVVSATVRGANDFTIEAYPNPVRSTVSVKVNGMVTGKGNVVVTDVTGKVVTTATAVENNSAELNVSHLANGMYLLNYTDDVRNESIKINKQ